jgi:hypothetical protein
MGPGSPIAGMALIVVMLVVFAVGSVGGYVALGRAAALVTTALGRRWKNRNTAAAVAAAVAAAALGAALYYVIMLPILDWAGLELRGHAEAERMGTLVRVGGLVGGALAVVLAGLAAYKAARSWKYCEACQRATQAHPLPAVPLGALRAMALAASAREFEAVAGLLGGPPGSAGYPQVFRCPGCGGGYLEVTADLLFTWTYRDSVIKHHETWLAASVPLVAHEMEHFRPYLGPR